MNQEKKIAINQKFTLNDKIIQQEKLAESPAVNILISGLDGVFQLPGFRFLELNFVL